MHDKILVKTFYQSILLTKKSRRKISKELSSFDGYENRFSEIFIYLYDVYLFYQSYERIRKYFKLVDDDIYHSKIWGMLLNHFLWENIHL